VSWPELPIRVQEDLVTCKINETWHYFSLLWLQLHADPLQASIARRRERDYLKILQ
jgi:hypothetical protein